MNPGRGAAPASVGGPATADRAGAAEHSGRHAGVQPLSLPPGPCPAFRGQGHPGRWSTPPFPPEDTAACPSRGGESWFGEALPHKLCAGIGRGKDVPFARADEPADGFSSCSRGAGESGEPGLACPPGSTPPRSTWGCLGRGLPAATAHRAGVTPSCVLRSGTWRTEAGSAASRGWHLSSPKLLRASSNPVGSVALSLLMATTGTLGPGRFPRNPGPWTCSGPAWAGAAPAAENPRSGRLSHRPARRRPPSEPQWLPRSCAAASLWP